MEIYLRKSQEEYNIAAGVLLLEANDRSDAVRDLNVAPTTKNFLTLEDAFNPSNSGHFVVPHSLLPYSCPPNCQGTPELARRHQIVPFFALGTNPL